MRSNQIVSVTDANQNFSNITKLAEKNGEVFIFKNNKPHFRLIDRCGAVRRNRNDG